MHPLMSEKVVLVDGENKPLGLAEKATVHRLETPLHRGFSCFLFRSNGDLILQQRAFSKVTWPGVWSNTCCGHPMLDETGEKAVKRRLEYELGIDKNVMPEVWCALPNFRYQAVHDGIMEHELCPVYVGCYDGVFELNPDEVESIQEVSWEGLVKALESLGDTTWDHLSVWCREEILLLAGSVDFRVWYKEKVGA